MICDMMCEVFKFFRPSKPFLLTNMTCKMFECALENM